MKEELSNAEPRCLLPSAVILIPEPRKISVAVA